MPNASHTPDQQRFESNLAPAGDCWRWMGRPSSSGYGRIRLQAGGLMYAHRWSYEYHRSAIPTGLDLDHLCRNTWCVNPWHLEPVSHHVNILRGTSPAADNARKTHCIHGHRFSAANTYRRPDTGTRQCRACNMERQRAKKNQGAF